MGAARRIGRRGAGSGRAHAGGRPRRAEQLRRLDAPEHVVVVVELDLDAAYRPLAEVFDPLDGSKLVRTGLGWFGNPVSQMAFPAAPGLAAKPRKPMPATMPMALETINANKI